VKFLRALFLFAVGIGLLSVGGFMLAGELALFAAVAGASSLFLALA
jgi:hypothetical protein